MPIVEYKYPANAMINFQPMADALDGYSKGMTVAGESTAKINAANAMKAGRYDEAAGELAKVDPRAAMEMSMHPQRKQQAANELEQSTRKLIGGTVHAGLALPPEMHGKFLESLIQNDPRYGSALQKSGVDWRTNPTAALQVLRQEALGAQDPDQEGLIRAQTEKALTVEQNTGTDLVRLKPGGGTPEKLNTVPAKPPPDHQWIDPTNPRAGATPIQGGKADVKYNTEKNAALTRLEGLEAQWENFERNIDAAVKHPGLPGNFGIQGKLPNWPGGDAANAWTRVEQLKSRGAFNELAAMREMSKTGGALGQVAVQELVRLENAATRLQTSQSPEAAVEALNEMRTLSQQARARIRTAYLRQYGEGNAAAVPTTPASGGDKPFQDRAPTTPGSQGQIPPDAIRFLQQNANNPQIIQQFQQKYGVDPRQFLQQR